MLLALRTVYRVQLVASKALKAKLSVSFVLLDRTQLLVPHFVSHVNLVLFPRSMVLLNVNRVQLALPNKSLDNLPVIHVISVLLMLTL
jgi:hypothetical protein